MKILVCTDGSALSIKSAELLAKFYLPKDTRVTVLGVSENVNHIEVITKAMDQINNSLGEIYLLDRKIRNGDPIEEIMSEAVESAYDLVAVGGGRDQLTLLDPRLGSTTSKLARKLHTHFLVTRTPPAHITKILFCVGSTVQANNTLRIGSEWISNIDAKITILHVSALGQSRVEKSEVVINQAKQILQVAGIKGEILSQIRQGIIVEEVIKELKKETYDLLVVGAHYQPGQDRWQSTLLDDVADQLLNKSSCSVLII